MIALAVISTLFIVFVAVILGFYCLMHGAGVPDKLLGLFLFLVSLANVAAMAGVLWL